MKHWYGIIAALATFLFGLGPTAQGQNWRPFRPGLIYSFSLLSNPVSASVYTLRLDSAYRTGSDSVYTFNRVMQPLTTSALTFRPSRNNLVGARLVCPATPGEYVLETATEYGQPGSSLLLRPRVAVGSAWNANATLTATLTARGRRNLGTVTDSVVTITLSNGRVVELSKNYGLLQGFSAWTSNAGVRLQQAALPVTYRQSLYSPLSVLDFQPGDEFGYMDNDFYGVGCYVDYELRRILTRQLTADSLIYTYQTQTRYVRYGGGCGGPSTMVSPVQVRRLALSLDRPRWQATGAMQQFAKLGLLTYEYAPWLSAAMMTGMPLSPVTGPCFTGGSRMNLEYARLYRNGPVEYRMGWDAAAARHVYLPGVGETRIFLHVLDYTRQRNPDGTYRTCGSATNFSTLLSNRSTQAAAQFQLYPNPAGREVTLQLPTAAPADARVTVFDMTGRRLRTDKLRSGQKELRISLQALPAGLYLVQLQNADGYQTALRLEHRP